MKVNLIYGAPCSGKSTYVRENMKDGEAVYDFDALYKALAFKTEHRADTNDVRWVTLNLRDQVVKKCDEQGIETLWMIASWPTESIIESLADYEVDSRIIESTKDECIERLDKDGERPDKDAWRSLIEKWFEEHSEALLERNARMERKKDDREQRQFRTCCSEFKTRESEGQPEIEGYFSVFNREYEMWPGAIEVIAPGAFSNTLGNDVRALINHDTTLVLGRSKAGTLELREDSHGLWGKIRINPNDQDAMNLYERVKRGDVDQCSFGFQIVSEDSELSDTTVRWTITEVNLFEVSVCTFPAYEDTAVSARRRDLADMKERKLDEWKLKLKQKLRRCHNGT